MPAGATPPHHCRPPAGSAQRSWSALLTAEAQCTSVFPVEAPQHALARRKVRFIPQ